MTVVLCCRVAGQHNTRAEIRQSTRRCVSENSAPRLIFYLSETLTQGVVYVNYETRVRGSRVAEGVVLARVIR